MGWNSQNQFITLIVSGGTGSGVFVYSPAPGLGNLVASITAGPGTDPYGNAYEGGNVAYAPGTPYTAIQTIGTDILFLTAPNGAGPWTARADIALNPSTFALSIAPAGPVQLGINDANLNTLAGLLQVSTPGHLTTMASLAETDGTSFTVTQAAATKASLAWGIPAGDASAGTVYRLTVWGFGTEGSTAQDLTVGVAIDGAQIRSSRMAALTANGTLRFRAVVDLHIVSAGAGGTADVNGQAQWSTTANPAVENSTAFGSPSAGAESFDTTAAHTMQLDLTWQSVTGGPTMTTFGSTFERLGP